MGLHYLYLLLIFAWSCAQGPSTNTVANGTDNGTRPIKDGEEVEGYIRAIDSAGATVSNSNADGIFTFELPSATFGRDSLIGIPQVVKIQGLVSDAEGEQIVTAEFKTLETDGESAIDEGDLQKNPIVRVHPTRSDFENLSVLVIANPESSNSSRQIYQASNYLSKDNDNQDIF